MKIFLKKLQALLENIQVAIVSKPNLVPLSQVSLQRKPWKQADAIERINYPWHFHSASLAIVNS